MLANLLHRIIRRKNPAFSFDPTLSTGAIAEMAWQKFRAGIRGLRLLWLGRAPRGLFLGRGVRFFRLSNIRFGKLVQLEDQVYLSALGKEPIVIGNHVRIGAYSRLISSTSYNQIGEYIRIGDHVGIGEFAYLGGAGGLEIGADCIIGQYFSCHPENHHFTDTTTPIRLQGVSRKGIHIGPGCWIGARVSVLDGVRIGRHCVIAAGSVVTRDIPDFSVAGGVPARVLRSLQPRSDQNPIPEAQAQG